MTKQVGDLLQRGPRVESRGGGGVPQSVRVDRPQAGTAGGAADDAADAGTGQRGERCNRGEEHHTNGARRAALAQVGDQCLSDIGRQRQQVDPVPFAVDPDGPVGPVDVLQP